MGKTKQQLIDDIELRISESKPSDDLNLSKEQIVHWLEVAGNSVVADYLSKKIIRGDAIPGEYVSPVLGLQLTAESAPANTSEGKRFYLDFSPYNVLTLPDNGGIVRVTTLSGKRIKSAKDEKNLERLRPLYFSKPSRENLFWYREGDKIFIEGYGNSITTAVKLNVFYVPIIDISSLADTAEVQISDDLTSIILDIVEDTALRELRGTRYDINNDGNQ